MSILSSIKTWLSFASQDINVILRNLRSDSRPARASASGWLQDLAPLGKVPPEAVPHIVTALHREDEHLMVITALIKALCHIGTKEAIMGVDWYLSKMARELKHLVTSHPSWIYEEGDTQTEALYVLEKVSDYIKPNLSSYDAIQFALLRAILDPNNSQSRRLRFFKILKCVDSPLLNVLDPNDRREFEEAAAVSDAAVALFSASTKIAGRIAILSLTNIAIDAWVEGMPNLNPIIKSFRDELLKGVGDRSVSYHIFELSDGTKIDIPKISDIPNTALFNFLDQLIDALTDPYSTLPPSLRPRK